MSKTTFYFVITTLILVDTVQSIYQKNLRKGKTQSYSMPNLEPSYLRYVHDKLISGALNPENASALPRGFIGLYEREFTQRTPVIERKSTLEQLALWSLIKGPVSARFIACILDLRE